MNLKQLNLQPGDRVTVAGPPANASNQIGVPVEITNADGVVKLVDHEYGVALVAINRPGAPDYVFVGLAYLAPAVKTGPESRIELTPFTHVDWYGFAGAERGPDGREPEICYLEREETGTGFYATVIADEAGVGIHLTVDEDDDGRWFQREEPAGMRLSVTVAASLRGADMEPSALVALGFKEH